MKPEIVAEEIRRIIFTLEIKRGMRILEPSANDTSISLMIGAVLGAGSIHCIKPQKEQYDFLNNYGFRLDLADFLEWEPEVGVKYDRILMNPCVSNDQDIDHVLRAFEFLAVGGKLVAFLNGGILGKKDPKVNHFREFIDQYGYVTRSEDQKTLTVFLNK